MKLNRLAIPALCLCSALPLAGQDAPLIYIDPGHGGEQPGVVSDGLEEKDLVLRWGFFVAEAFAEVGYETLMSRTGDVTRSFQDRVDEASARGADLFFSLHINGDEDPTQWGTEIFLAEELPASVTAAEAVARAFEDMGAKVTLIGQPWDVLKSDSFPTLMIELGHMTHPVERRLVVSRDYWMKAARALVAATEAVVGPPM